MLRVLNDIVASGSCRRTLYLTQDSLDSARAAPSGRAPDPGLGAVARMLEDSGTGAVLFQWDDRTLAVMPPFPVERDLDTPKAHTALLAELLERQRLVGVVLLRLGRYAVGVVDGDSLLASKSDTRYVKSRHRAGGSSQRRFERSRERLVRELFDKACQVTKAVMAPFERRIDHVMLGGERHTLRAFAQRCPYLRQFDPITLQRVLDVDRPGRKALEGVHYEVWKSRVLIIEAAEQTEN